mmetsp:Transcript_41673/g.63677  ORF Transcript_41673/g.63677 Transcript_41673/m.63677 type:complete len:151 (-) Transcript_41673:501-953(-)
MGIIYRDLKPENILIDTDGNIKLADFGISRKISSNAARSTTLIGTAQYIPPEAHAKDKGYDYSFDMWSLGCCLYEIVVGEPPYGHAELTASQMKNIVLSKEYNVKDYFSKDFKRLLEGLLHKNPHRRLTLGQAKAHPFFKKMNWQQIQAR